MTSEEMKRVKWNVVVVGSGVIGKQLAVYFASFGHQVILVGRNANSLGQARQAIEEKLRKKGDYEKLLVKIRYSTDISDVAGVDLVIEAVNESLEVKKQVLTLVDTYADERTIVGTNTSSISVKALSKFMKRPERFLGIHFFNPVSKMGLVELIRAGKTSDLTLQKTAGLMKEIDKEVVIINDTPAFVVNRVLMPLINEGVRLVENGIEPAIIDKAVKLGLNHPMGPLELADLIGIDTCVSIMQNISQQLGDSKYAPSPILLEMIRSNRLGKKTGSGFYEYPIK